LRAAVKDISERCPLLWKMLKSASTNWASINRERTFKIKDENLAEVRAFMSFAITCYSFNQKFNFIQFFLAEALNLRGANTSTLFHALGITMNRNITTDWVQKMAAFDTQYFLDQSMAIDDRLTFLLGDNLDFTFVNVVCCLFFSPLRRVTSSSFT
jgi:hypothetical protein